VVLCSLWQTFPLLAWYEHGMEEAGVCKHCHARLLWVSTQNGKRMPLDHEPERRFVLDSGASPMVGRLRNTYTCHLETCRSKP
jgi:hypothetical protein